MELDTRETAQTHSPGPGRTECSKAVQGQADDNRKFYPPDVAGICQSGTCRPVSTRSWAVSELKPGLLDRQSLELDSFSTKFYF